MGSKKNRKYKKQPKVYSNRFTKLIVEQGSRESVDSQENEMPVKRPRPTVVDKSLLNEETPRSSKQLRLEPSTENDGKPEESTNYYIIMNFNLLQNIISQVGSCP